MTDPGGVSTTYTYDAQNRLRTAVVPGAGTTTYALSPDGLALGSTRPGVNERRCYDAGGRLKTIVTSKSAIKEDCEAATPISRFDYAYDANGNRVSQLEQRTDPGSQSLQAPESTSYGYDDLDRLTSVLYPDDRGVFYGLDPVGNRRNECEARPSIAGAITTLALCLALAPPALAVNIERHFDAGDRLIQRVDHLDPNRSQVLGYDPNGNRISEFGGGRSRSYAWDVRNTLTSVSDDGLQVGRYDYDPELQRVKRSAQGLAVEYVLDDHFVLLETAPGGTRVRRYHYSHDPLAVAESTGPPQWLHADALGSVTDTTSTAGDVTAARQHDAWGEYRNGTAPDANEARLGFTGHQYDPESALTYARARYYDAANGVFLSRDPYEGNLNDAPSLQRYLYGRGSPAVFVDKDGRCAVYADGKLRCFAPEQEKANVLAQGLNESLADGNYGQAAVAAPLLVAQGINQIVGLGADAVIDLYGETAGRATEWLDELQPGWDVVLATNPLPAPRVAGSLSWLSRFARVQKKTQKVVEVVQDSSGLVKLERSAEVAAKASKSIPTPVVQTERVAAEIARHGGQVTPEQRRFLEELRHAHQSNPSIVAMAGDAKLATSNRTPVALDTNALIAAVERGQSILDGRTPVVPITVAKEFLRGEGSSAALREFLTIHGGRIGQAGSEATAAGLRQQAANLGRALHLGDSRVAAGAMREGIPLITNDRKFGNFLRAIDYPVEGF